MRQGFEVLQKPYDLRALQRALHVARKAVEQTDVPAPQRATGDQSAANSRPRVSGSAIAARMTMA